MDKVKLARNNGVLKVDIDGQLFEPLSFKSFRPTARNISDFSKAGVKLFSILSSGMISLLQVPYSLFGESWLDDETYDFEPIDRQIDLFMKNAPDGYFALMLQLDTRPWYVEKYGVPYSFTHLSQIIGDEKWRSLAAKYLKAAITHTEEKYGDRFYGYFMLCGFTTEWFSQFDEEATHPIKENVYRRYFNDDTLKIPEKEKLETDSSQAFVPKEYRDEVRKYRGFNADLISDSILYFASEAQSVIKHKKLLGVYFGYLFELNGPRLWNTGHIGYEKIFTSPDIDMISSPSSYQFRTYDSTSAFMVTYDTLDKHDKLYYLEFDHITHLAPPTVEGILIPGGDSKLPDHKHTLDVMQRDFMLCVSKGAALWWFDMFEGWFYSDEMMASIKEMIEISKLLNAKKHESVAEILVIASGKSLLGVNKNSEINSVMLGAQRGGLAKMGAPYDVYSTCDLDKINIDKYKLVIFLDAFETDEQTKAFAKRIKSDGRTILWIYAPNYATDGLQGIQQTTDINIVELIGEENSVSTHHGVITYNMPKPRFFVEDGDAMPLGIYQNTEKVAIAAKRFADYTSVYSAVGNLNGGILMEIAKLAGVRIYCENPETPVYISSLVKGIYANCETELLLDDGEYTDLFSGETITAKDGKVLVPAGNRASKLFIKKD